MNYNFSFIRNISEFEPYLKDEKTFRKVVKDGYVVFNYNGLNPDNFPPVETLDDTYIRECRGIAFDANTGNIIARPFHKFFNMDERPETSNIDFINVPHIILEKLDGSMVFPLYLSNGTRLATKGGITDVSMKAERFIADKKHYQDFIGTCNLMGYTPIFEYVAPDNQIVIRYDEPQLILLAMRAMYSGAYHNIHSKIGEFDSFRSGIPIVKKVFDNDSIMNDNLLHKIRSFDTSEGVVVTFANGHRIKIKADLYVKLHRYIDITRSERLFVNSLLSEEFDDLYANADRLLKDKIDIWKTTYLINEKENAESIFNTYFSDNQFAFNDEWTLEEKRAARKDFALFVVNNVSFPYIRQLMFKVFEFEKEKRHSMIHIELRNIIRNSTKKEETWLPIKKYFEINIF